MVVDKEFYAKCRDGKIEEVRKSLESDGADPNSTGTNAGYVTCLMRAAGSNHLSSSNQDEMVALLLAHKDIEVNKRDDLNRTALHYACICGNDASLRRLLAVPGLDLNPQDWQNWSPIMCAVNNGMTEAVRLMCGKEEVDLACKYPDGRSLHENTDW